MRVRSTGLGKQEMKAGIQDIQVVKENSLIMRLETVEPVQWHIRIVMGPADMRTLVRQLIRPINLLGAIKLLLFKRGQPNPEGDW